MSARTYLAPFLSALALSLSTTTVTADGFDKCTTDAKDKWKPPAEAEAAAKAAGYDVRKVKTEGTCYEVYAMKGGKKFELFYNPVTLELVKSQED
ncbi:MAG: PepSY domain-containing protein [Hyphomicrobiaceae bacterium]|nr:PepSY domain-containing protein [Hyphomicrobiaceae bacterium]